MTTIATDGKSMAGDGLVTDGGHMITDTAFRKIKRLPNGLIVGVCGSAFDTVPIWEHFALGTPLQNIWDKTEALILYPDGSVQCMNDKGQLIDCPSVQALGSGGGFAMAAMRAGADPATAVAVASTLDTLTGGEIVAEYL